MKKKRVVYFLVAIIFVMSVSTKSIFSSINTKQNAQRYYLNNDEMIVYNGMELKSVIEDSTNGIDKIYFGADIQQIAGGIEIPSNKTNLTISGTNPQNGKRFNYYEYRSRDARLTIHLDNARYNEARLTLKDMNILGENYYGTINIADRVLDAKVTYENIDYYGPQLIWNRNGNAQIKDSKINIPRSGFYSSSHEVGELKHLTITGDNQINHDAYSFAMFNFSGSENKVIFDEQSYLNVSCSTSFNNGSYSSLDFTMKKGSTFNIDSNLNSGSFIMGKNGLFVMEEDSSLKANTSGRIPLINWTSNYSQFIMKHAHLENNSISNQSTSTLYLGKVNMDNSSVVINNNYDNTNYYMSFSDTQHLNNSSIEINQKGTSTNVYSGIYSKGDTILNNSYIDILGKGKMGNKLLETNKLYLTRSRINGQFDYGLYGSGNINAIDVKDSLNMNDSQLYLNVEGDTSGLVSADKLDSFNNSQLSVYASNLNNHAKNAVAINEALEIGRNSSFKVILDNIEYSSGEALSINGNLRVNKNATFQVINKSGNHKKLVNLKGRNRELVIDNPYSFLLYGPSTKNSLLSGDNQINFYIETQQSNSWASAPGFRDEYIIDNLPNTTFFKDDKSNLNFNGQIKKDKTTLIYNNLNINDDSPSLDSFTFNSKDQVVLAMGQSNLDHNTIKENDNNITGKSDPNAFIKVYYYNNHSYNYKSGYASMNGTYCIDTKKVDLNGIKIISMHDFLYSDISTSALPTGKLEMIKSPVDLDFGKYNIPTKKTKIPTQKNWNIEIKDTRTDTSNWRLYVKLSKPMNANDKNKPNLKNALVYIDKNNKKEYISEDKLVLVAQSINGKTDTIINGNNKNGIFLEINPGSVFSNTNYHGEIEWILSPM